MKITVFVLSKDAVSLAGLEAIVGRDDRVGLVGRALSGADTLPDLSAAGLRPDVVILDEPPSRDFICDSVSRILRCFEQDRHRTRFVVISRNDDDEVVIAALRSGAGGYLARVTSPEELLRTLQIVAQGGAAFCPSIAARLAGYLGVPPDQPVQNRFADLTDRELDVLQLITIGLGNHQIARQLYLSEKTVRNYVSQIFRKLGVHDRAAAALRARDAGLGAPTSPLAAQHA